MKLTNITLNNRHNSYAIILSLLTEFFNLYCTSIFSEVQKRMSNPTANLPKPTYLDLPKLSKLEIR